MEIINKINKYGFLSSLKIVLKKITNTEINIFHYLKIDIDYECVKNQIKNIDIIVKELEFDDFLKGDKREFDEKKIKLIKHRLKDNSYRAFGIVKEDKLVYSTWIGLEKLGLPMKSNYKLLADEGLLEDSYCHPAERGKGLHSIMNYFRLVKLYELGKTKCIAIVLKGNSPAYQVQMKTGFKKMGDFYAGKILGIPFTTLNKKKYDSR